MGTAAQGLSIVIPFYNEADNVLPLLRELRAMIEENKLAVIEVLTVDDGSKDGTGEILEFESQNWPLLRVVHHRTNRGQAAALWTAFTQVRGEIVVTLDGDGQNDPADIPRLLSFLREGVDMVTGFREIRRDPRLRKEMSRLANRIRCRVLGDQVSDAGCALKVFRREVCGSFLPIRTLYSFMPAFAVAHGFAVIEAPVLHRPRGAGTSKYGLVVMAWRPFLDMLGVFWYIRRHI
jgi:dolichol-phosphate mannosyltransferase